MSNNNNNLVPGFNDEKDDSLKISLERIDSIQNGLRIYLNGYIDTYNANAGEMAQPSYQVCSD